MQSYDRKVLVSALKACDTHGLMEDAFSRFNEHDKKIRVECLNECMGNPKTFHPLGDKTQDTEILYDMTVAMFLTGAWKTAMLYKQLGRCNCTGPRPRIENH